MCLNSQIASFLQLRFPDISVSQLVSILWNFFNAQEINIFSELLFYMNNSSSSIKPSPNCSEDFINVMVLGMRPSLTHFSPVSHLYTP